MRIQTILLILALFLWFIFGSWWYLNSSCNSCNTSGKLNTAASVVSPASISGEGLYLNDSSLWSSRWTDNLRFKKSAETPSIPTSILPAYDSLNAYLSRNNNQKILTLVGNYGAQEVNNTSYKNLGIARAEQVKKILIERGLDRNLIFTESKLNDDLVNRFADSIWGGLDYRINTLGGNLELSEEVLLQPRIVYFETGKNSLRITPELSNYFNQAQSYLATHSDKSLAVTGHTDNVGDPVKNQVLSKSRADFVKSELIKKKISATQIITDGQGDKQPLLSNDTPEGRSQNRRVEIKIN